MKKIRTVLLSLAFLSIPVIWGMTTLAAGKFGLESVSILEKTENVIAKTPTVSNNTISSVIVFHEVDDYVKYNFNFKNTTRTSYKIINITDDNTNEFVEYSYENHADEVIESNGALDLELTITYIKKYINDEDRTQNNNVKFIISYLDLKTGEEEEEELDVLLVPDTSGTTKNGSANGTTSSIGIAIIAVAGLVLIIAVFTKKKRTIFVSAFAIAFATTGLFSMNSSAEDYLDLEVNLGSEIRLRDYFLGELYWKDPDTGDDMYVSPNEFGELYYSEGATFGEIFPIEYIPTPYGLEIVDMVFTGTNESIDPEALILDDFSVTFIYAEKEYNITYNYGSGEVATANPTKIKNSDSEFTLNKPTKDGAIFSCWRESNMSQYECEEDITIDPATVDTDLEYTALYAHEVTINDQFGNKLNYDAVPEGKGSVTYSAVFDRNHGYTVNSGTCTNNQRLRIHANKTMYEVDGVTHNTVCTLNVTYDTYNVSLVVNNGTGSDTKSVEYNKNITFNNIAANDGGYTLIENVSCTNGQTATYSNGTVTVNNVTSNTTCTMNATPPTIHSITYMQEMTPEICAATTTPSSSFETANHDDWDGSHFGDENYIPRTVLVDTRDQQKYLVAKLADGECWMTQNLNLTMSTTKALTKEDTDLQTKDSYTPDRNTLPSMPTTGSPYGNFATVSDMQLSWHANYEYYVDTEQYPGMGVKVSEAPTSDSDEYLWQQAGIFYTGYVLSAGTYPYNGGSGVYYTDTICPKGWTLPEGRYNAEEGRLSKSFDKLYATYAPGRTQQEYIAFNKTTIFRPVYAGYYISYGNVTYSGSTNIMMLSSNYISPYNGQHNRISVLKAAYTTFTPTYVASDVSAFGAYGLNARCIAR